MTVQKSVFVHKNNLVVVVVVDFLENLFCTVVVKVNCKQTSDELSINAINSSLVKCIKIDDVNGAVAVECEI